MKLILTLAFVALGLACCALISWRSVSSHKQQLNLMLCLEDNLQQAISSAHLSATGYGVHLYDN